MSETLPATADAHLQALVELLSAAGVPLNVVASGSLDEVVAAHPGDQARTLGIVVLAAPDDAQDSPIAAAYYMRPVERDAGGHLQRRPPALLAAWDAQASRYDHFDWAVTDELAARAGMTRADFENEVRRRESELAEIS
jgi:hypothetical protein